MRARQCLIYKLWLMGKLWQWRSTLYVFLLAYHKLYFKQHTNIVTLKPLRWHVCFISFWFELWAKLILDSFWHKHFFHHSIEKVLKNTKHVLTYKTISRLANQCNDKWSLDCGDWRRNRDWTSSCQTFQRNPQDPHMRTETGALGGDENIVW